MGSPCIDFRNNIIVSDSAIFSESIAFILIVIKRKYTKNKIFKKLGCYLYEMSTMAKANQLSFLNVRRY